MPEAQLQLLGEVSVNAVVEQLVLAASMFGSALVAAVVWWVHRRRSRRRRVEYGQEDTQRLAIYQEPSRGVLMVIAGNYDEYQRYCAYRKLNRYHDAVLVQFSQQIFQRPGSTYVIVGTARAMPHFDVLESALAAAGCRSL